MEEGGQRCAEVGAEALDMSQCPIGLTKDVELILSMLSSVGPFEAGGMSCELGLCGDCVENT